MTPDSRQTASHLVPVIRQCAPSRGRAIPVDLGKDDRQSSNRIERPVQNNVFNLNGVRDFDTFKKSKGETQRQVISSMQCSQLRG